MISLWKSEPVLPQIMAMRRQLCSPSARKLGWSAKSGESDADIRLRALLLHTLVESYDSEVINEAQKLFPQYMADPKSVPSELRSVIFSAMMKRLDGFDTLKDAFGKVIFN